MKVLYSILMLCSLCLRVAAQADTEFPREFIMHLKLHNGMATNFSSQPDQYVGGLQLVPQYTLVKNKLRGGIVAGAYYTAKELNAAMGPTLSYKLKTFKAAPFGSAGNVHLSLEHLWGTNKERLLGGGIHVDIANKIVLGLTAHRDYNLNTWWFQNSLGIRISKVKKLPEL